MNENGRVSTPDAVAVGVTAKLIDGSPPSALLNGAVAEAVVIEPPAACASVPVADVCTSLLVFFLPTVPPTAPPTTAPMTTKAMITPMSILPFGDPQNEVLLPSGGFSLRGSYELNDLPTGPTFPCSMPEPCENAGSAGGAAPGGVD